MTMELHYTNRILPPSVVSNVRSDDEANWRDIEATMTQLKNAKSDIVDTKVIGKLHRLVNARLDLKYNITTVEKSIIVRLLLHLYADKKLSIPMKINTTDVLYNLFKKKGEVLDLGMVSFPWKLFWDEALSTSLREQKIHSTGSENLISSIVKNNVTLLHTARSHISDDDAQGIVNIAMSLMKDMRASRCLEATVMLVTCLPTKYSKYDALLEQAVRIWPQIDHHPDWDSCWLTLLCRARKSRNLKFDWSKLKTFLYLKAREHFELPAIKGNAPRSAGIPIYYSKLLPPQQFDTRNICVHKIAKLLYLEALRGPVVRISPTTTTPPKLPDGSTIQFPGFNNAGDVAEGTKEMMSFLQSLRPYFQPSNVGPWSTHLAYFISTYVAEICRHVAKSLCHQLDPNPQGPNVFETGMDIPTIKFICGSLLILIIEGLYGKNMTMMQFSVACLKNLASLHDDFADIVFPILLNALDEKAVNQSHQAPVAMNTITVAFRQFMYPQPVALKYLPELLRLSIHGIDSNDPMKTGITLNMYCHIFHWIPIKIKYDEMACRTSYRVSYLDMLENNYSNIVDASSATIENTSYAEAFAHLGPAIETWVIAFFDKVFNFAENREKPRENEAKSHSSPSNTGAALCEAIDVVCSSADDEVHAMITKKVLEYLKSGLPVNAAKEMAKLLEALVGRSPCILPDVIEVLIDDDIINNKCSYEKLAFRLRLIGGALRRAGSVSISVMDQIQPLFTKACQEGQITTEKTTAVRQAAGKLIKDSLKGLASFYPRPQAPVGIGELNHANTAKVTWYSPGHDALESAASILKETVSESMQKLSTICQQLYDSNESKTVNIKETEETLLSHLCVIFGGIQGAAEVLGDSHAFDSDDSDINMGIESQQEQEMYTIVDTGRKDLKSSEATAKLLSEFRFHVLKFLISINKMLSECSDSSSLAVFRASSGMRCELMNIYHCVILQRMASFKQMDQDKKWYNMEKRINRSLIVKYMLFHSRAFKDTVKTNMSTIAYWRCHDLPSYNFNIRARLAFAKKQKEFSHASVRKCTNGKNQALTNLYLEGLSQLTSLCGHDYESIRNKAVSIFGPIASRFGWRLTDIIMPLISKISTAGTTYAEASGAFSIISQPYIMKRILGQWELTIMFMKSIEGSVGMIASIEEGSDKKEILLHRLTNAFNNYVSNFHHHAFHDGSKEANEASSIVSSYIKQESSTTTSTTTANGSSDSSAASFGMRHTTFASYLVLHMVGHDDVVLPQGVWKWATRVVMDSIGEPAQIIGLAAMSKIAYILSLNNGHKNVVNLRREVEQSLPKMKWTKLLAGIARDHPKSEGNGDEWSGNFNQILRGTMYLALFLPRSRFATTSDHNTFSKYFKKEHAILFTSLACINTTGKLTIEFMDIVFNAANDVPTTNEDETKDLNALKAEIFSGFCRAVFEKGSSAVKDLNSTDMNAIQVYLKDKLAENINSISLEFSRDWAEALSFGLSSAPINVTNALTAYILQELEMTMLKSDKASMEVTGEEGFSRQSKLLILTTSLLNTDICNCSINNVGETAVGRALLDLFTRTDVELISPYRTSRDNIAEIIALLSETSSSKMDMIPLLKKMSAQYFTGENEDKEDESIKLKIKNAALCCQHAMDQFFKVTSGYRISHLLVDLFTVLLDGCGHGEIEVAKQCHNTTIMVCSAVQVFDRDALGPEDPITALSHIIQRNTNNPSWHIRETVQIVAGVLLVNNWMVLSTDERKSIRDVFNEGMLDSKPEVQNLARLGMTAYLVAKPIEELNTLANAYIKNCNAFAEREKKKRKQGIAPDIKPDKVYTNTLGMSSCMILSFPYDLPDFAPSLLHALLRHSTVPSSKDTVMKTIQDFKRTHQDRWDSEFKHKFSADQLEDLQGAGAMSYYS